MDYTKLDSEQYEAVVAEGNRICIMAIAGSGKTTVLTHRVAHLIGEKRVPPEQIMLLTFTNKAANEMKSRVTSLLNASDIGIKAGTFHSIANVYLRRYAEEIGFRKNFIILDEDDSVMLTKRCRDEHFDSIGRKVPKDFPTAKTIYSNYSKIINLQLNKTEVAERMYEEHPRIILNIWERYRDRKRLLRVMDFDDLLGYFIVILKKNEIRQQVLRETRYVLVDEYQDINWLQDEILNLIIDDASEFFVIGDKAQCIYQFRGSRDDFIEKIEDDDSGYFQKFKITNNYRSTPEILDIASCVINADKPLSKSLVLNAFHGSGEKPTISEFFDEKDTATNVVAHIKREYLNDLKNTAIITRTNRQQSHFETALLINHIPYEITSGLGILERKHIKDIMALVAFISDPSYEPSFFRALNLLTGVGQKTVVKIWIESNSGVDFPNPKTTIPKKAIEEYKFLADLRNNHKRLPLKLDEIATYVYNGFYADYIKRNSTSPKKQEDDIDVFIPLLEEYDTYAEFINDIRLDDMGEEQGLPVDKLCLTTSHKSKGLEWDNVFIPFLNESVFPATPRDNVELELKAERNLFYVSATRARKKLHLSYTKFFYAKSVEPSRFLNDIPEEMELLTPLGNVTLFMDDEW